VFDSKRIGRIQYRMFVEAIMRPDRQVMLEHKPIYTGRQTTTNSGNKKDIIICWINLRIQLATLIKNLLLFVINVSEFY